MAKGKAKAMIKVKVKPKLAKRKPKNLNLLQSPQHIVSATEEAPSVESYEVIAEQAPQITIQSELEKNPPAQLTAQEILDKPLKELEKDFGKREAQNLLKSMKILTAIMLGKNKNKELAKVLDTDKSFTSKQIRSLEEQGLVKREGTGKETKYEVDRFNVMKFLESKVVIKWSKAKETNARTNGDKENGDAGTNKEDS